MSTEYYALSAAGQEALAEALASAPRGRSRSTSASSRGASTARPNHAGPRTTAAPSLRRGPRRPCSRSTPTTAGDLVVPLTVRHDDLRAHAGEVSLPGGTVDATDAARQAAALREAWEEVGLAPADVRIVGVARRGLDPGQQLRAAAVRRRPSPTGRRWCRTTPRWRRSSSCRWPRLWDPDVVGVEAFERARASRCGPGHIGMAGSSSGAPPR